MIERRDLSGGAHVLVSVTLEEAGFLAVFTERTGGVSSEEFASLNLSYSSGDQPRKVAANRSHVIEALGIGPFALGGQVHGANIAQVGPAKTGSGWDGPDGVISGTDGLSTRSKGLPLAVATADCVPVILASGAEGRIAVIHAGWRGVAAGIIEKAASLFPDRGSVVAVIGPCAGVCHYEVGPDVALAVSAGTGGGAVTQERGGSLYLDLSATISGSLTGLGIEAEETRLCTIHEADRFFSHRRDGPCGRQMAIGMRRP
ncbi:MAG: polyphenol oxidase family protein [Actinomycetota bacterium]